MIELAVELSSVEGSIALLRDGKPADERSWLEKSARAQHIFHELPGLLAAGGVAAADLGGFLVGRGPGSYSGLRVAITAARSLALPGARPVYTVSSGEALALELAAERGPGEIAILGDARRGTLWLGLFRAAGGGVTAVIPWTVVAAGELAAKLPANCLVASPDAARLAPVLSGLRGFDVIREDRHPRARWVGELAVARRNAGVPSEPLVPIYVHPAVGSAPAAGT